MLLGAWKSICRNQPAIHVEQRKRKKEGNWWSQAGSNLTKNNRYVSIELGYLSLVWCTIFRAIVAYEKSLTDSQHLNIEPQNAIAIVSVMDNFGL